MKQSVIVIQLAQESEVTSLTGGGSCLFLGIGLLCCFGLRILDKVLEHFAAILVIPGNGHMVQQNHIG